MAIGIVDDALVRAEVGYAGATALLCTLLWTIYRSASPAVARPADPV